MQNLGLAVLFSVLVSVLLKVAKRGKIQIDQAIAFNYISAGALAYYVLKPNFDGVGFNQFLMTSSHMSIFIALGFLLPTVFIIMAKAINVAGIVRADAAQRLSLILPILASFLLFGQTLTHARLIGIILAFLALFCLVKKPNAEKGALGVIGAVSLLLVWAGYGVIDILFKEVAKMGGAFPNTLFASFVLGGGILFIYLVLKRVEWTIPSVLGGLFLGCLNFGNILFYIKAHQSFSGNPTLVFASMNIGVIILATLAGAAYFKEKISKINWLGLVLGVLAIWCLFYLDKFMA
ncbi:DMT family transporter [Actinobacillus delphinicola]|uniref:Putative integral membrane protein n=1 Tax=Actinobacillus delphinicola TaxID=51161 RepID=A0A448TVX0_9PAST|nr:DMT family transporter [Actinobacillus delphinicola]VEJ10069.1 putative integral membrane protein [Actinobacillus delphinicola]